MPERMLADGGRKPDSKWLGLERELPCHVVAREDSRLRIKRKTARSFGHCRIELLVDLPKQRAGYELSLIHIPAIPGQLRVS